ncbi:MAG: hypothetical protein V2I82_13155 [Halieaceae bacterium]|jgi:hypothetical protein|nr:hypothetical protein [Halieaceae bacterium]
MIRRVPILAIAVALTACSTNLIVPAYDARLDTAVSSAHTAAAKITACIDLGLCATAESFAEQEANYIEAIANLKTAGLIAGSLPASNDTARASREDLVSFVDGCREQLVSLAQLHLAGQTKPELGMTQSVDVSCDQALRAAQAMKQGGDDD